MVCARAAGNVAVGARREGLRRGHGLRRDLGTVTTLVAPSGEGGERAMRKALATLPEDRKVGYINAHGTSTPVGDVGEVEAVRRTFGADAPPISSTNSMTGHSQGRGGGAQEAIYCLLML